MPTPNFNVRPVHESDLNDWFRLRKLLWDENDDGDHEKEMMDIMSHPESQLVLVADAGQSGLVGFLEASIRPFVEDCQTDHVGYLEGWFVDSDHRRAGVGRELVRKAEEWARQKGCTEMASDAEVGNEGSLNAHTRLGYEVTARLVHLRKELED